jgi:hypothetical protein
MAFKELINAIEELESPPAITEYDLLKETIDEYKKIHSITHNTYFESPVYTGNYGGSMNEQGMNQMRANTVKVNSRKIGTYTYAESNFDLYRTEENGKVEINLIWNNTMFAMYCYYKELPDGGAEIDSSWNHQEMRGIFTEFFWDKLLSQYQYIQSSRSNTLQSAKFWVNVAKEAIQRGNKFQLINLVNHDWHEDITDYKTLERDFKEIWSNSSEHIRLRVYSK